MIFVRQGYAAVILVTLTIVFQSAGIGALIQWMKAQFPGGIHRLGHFRSFSLVVRFTSLLVCLHMSEILLWASFYRWKCFSGWEEAFYFSMANYATVGAGDLFLKQMWRAMGPVESVTGVLMCGLSASFLFAVVTRLIRLEDPGLTDPGAGAPTYAGTGAGAQSCVGARETVNISESAEPDLRWSGRVDSNHRPPGPEPGALPG
jgi:voltage-gated potassium channel